MMVNHGKLSTQLILFYCFKCHTKLDKSAFRPFTNNTTVDGLAEEDRKIILKPKRKHSYYYCPCCLENLVVINGSGYHYEIGYWVKITSFEFNPSSRDDIQKRDLKKEKIKSLEEDPSRESGHI